MKKRPQKQVGVSVREEREGWSELVLVCSAPGNKRSRPAKAKLFEYAKVRGSPFVFLLVSR